MRDAVRPSTRPPAARARRGARRAVVLALLVVLASGFIGAPTSSAAPARGPGALTVSGYDYFTEARGDVVAGDPETNLVIEFTASRPLQDGTLTIALPAREWREPLQVGDRLSPYDATARGAVVVRPSVDYDSLTPGDCRGPDDQTPPSVTVSNQRAVRIATVSHLTCAAGQSITVRAFGVRAPERVGRTYLLTAVGDASGQAGTVLPLDVRRVPTTRLVLTPTRPSGVQTDDTVTFTITAVDPRGRPDRGYRGTVNLVRLDEPCFVGVDERLPVSFTWKDRGQKTLHVSFSTYGSFRLRAYDVEKHARPGDTDTIEVTPDANYEPTTCSVAYH